MSSILMFSVALMIAIQESPSQPQQEISGVEYFYQLRQADQRFANRKYADALEIYQRLAKSDPQNGKLFEKIFQCHTNLGNRDAAAQATLQMVRLGHGSRVRSYYRIARNHALKGEFEQAYQWVDKSLTARMSKRSAIQRDFAFKSVRDNPRYIKLAGLLPKKKLTRDQGWRYDIEFFASEVARLSGDPDRYGVSEEFLKQIKALGHRVPNLSNEHIALEIQKLATSLGNGHTNVYPLPTKHVRFTMLPIQLYLFSDGMFVVGGKGPAADLVGHKVLSIGSKAPSTLMKEVKSIVHRDNEFGVLWLGPQFLSIPEVLEYLGAIKSTDQVSLKLQDRQGKTKTIVLKSGPMRRPEKLDRASSKDKAPLYLQDVSNNYWLRKLPASNTIYVQFNQVRDKQSGKSIKAFAETLRQTIVDSKPQNLIVDLRHNNGGLIRKYQPLVRPLVLFEMLDKKNRLYIITGRGTFSAAQNYLNAVESVTDPIIVGEPSSSRPNSVGMESEVILPWSGLRMCIAYRFIQDSMPDDWRPWISPHVPIKLSSTDYFSNRDPAMDAIKKIIRKSGE